MPVELRRRINGFYNYVWASMQYMDQSHAIKGLPPQLKLQLLLAINMRQLARVPIFKHCDTRVILMIVQRMQSAIYCPNEFVVRYGAIGKALYLIASGVVRPAGHVVAGALLPAGVLLLAAAYETALWCCRKKEKPSLEAGGGKDALATAAGSLKTEHL